jgi:hypothetical protein
MDQSNVDYEQMKNLYPLRGVNKDDLSSPENPAKISANDISAFNDDSMVEQPASQVPQMNLFGKNNFNE